jgi:hypothetical protein
MLFVLTVLLLGFCSLFAGKPITLADCSHLTTSRSDAQQNGDLRLVPSEVDSSLGNPPFQGRVEIFLQGKWGTVRYDASGHQQVGAAQTICRQLGFPAQERCGLAAEFRYVNVHHMHNKHL